MAAARTEPIDPPADEAVRVDQADDATPDPVESPQIAELRATIASLTAQVAKQAAQLSELCGPVEMIALKAADAGGHCGETVKNWIKSGKVDGYQIGKKWFVHARSLARYLAQIGLEREITAHGETITVGNSSRAADTCRSRLGTPFFP
jgi:hypothetical protein